MTIYLKEVAQYKFYQDKLSQDDFNKITQIYPKYDKWLLNNHSSILNFSDDKIIFLKDTLSKYEKMSNKKDYLNEHDKNIMNLSLSEVTTIVSNKWKEFQSKYTKSKTAKDEIKIIYNDDNWFIFNPLTKDSSQYWGRDIETKKPLWCTANSDEANIGNMFYTYCGKDLEQGLLTILIYKPNPKIKYQFFEGKNEYEGRIEFRNSENELLTEEDKKFFKDNMDSKIKELFSKDIQAKMQSNWVWGNRNNGEYKERHSNGQLHIHCFYKDGRNNGEYKEWHSNGQLNIHCFYKDGRRDGEYKEWYKNGQERIHCFYKNGEYDGEYKEWYENGQLNIHCFYKNGNLDGEYISWYNNGQERVHCFYKNGNSDGEFKSWYDNGKLHTHCFFKDGNFDGEYKEWYKNGQERIHCFYKNGEKDGEYKRWYSNGKLDIHYFYKDGELIKNYLEKVKKYIVRLKD
ncbi:MAG TPA: toxin-antitoxin system YwqK family antitoxin [Bacteroidales bacterium]|nr:toxin-antitoxin system YwqK family antitoxin [Bacteroidales bacterium]